MTPMEFREVILWHSRAGEIGALLELIYHSLARGDNGNIKSAIA